MLLENDEVHYLVNSARPQVERLNIGRYPNAEPLVRHGDFRAITRICVRPRSLETLLAAFFWVDALVERGHSVPELVLPCLPGARQDRLNPEGDYLFTAKSVAKMINERKFPRVITVDPHSEVMPALIERCHVVHSVDVLASAGYWRNYAGVIAPDAGAAKRALAVAQLYKIPVHQAWKKRSVADGSIAGFGIEPIQALTGSAYLVVDDICDGGGTFLGLAELLPGVAEVDLFVTHGIFSQGLDKLRKYYANIVTTDSLPQFQFTDGTDVTVIPICQQLLEKGRL